MKRLFKGLSRQQNRIFFIMQGGMFLEYFDLFLYIHLAPIVVDEYFSPASTDTLMVYMLTIFSVLFIRLLGVALGGYVGDVYGRKLSMIISIIITGCCCIGFAILPSFDTIGIIALLGLMFFRSLQSAASVNEISCAVTYMTEIIDRPYAFFITAIMENGAFIGMFVALFTASLVMNVYPEGWKILFFVSGMLSFISFYYRKKVPESTIMVNDVKSYTSGKHRRQAYWKEVKKTLFSKLPLVQISIEMFQVLFFYLVYIHCSIILKNEYGFTGIEIIKNNTIVALFELVASFCMVTFIIKYHPAKILKYRLFPVFILFLLVPFLLPSIKSADGVLIFQCLFIIFSAYKGNSLLVLLYPILCRVSMRSVCYTLSKLAVGLVGAIIILIGEILPLSTSIFLFSIIIFIFYYLALQFLTKKEKSRYDTPKYRKAMKKSYEWGAKMFENHG